jgi:predicted nucleic acid-binding protein
VLRIMSQAGYSSPQPLSVLINMLQSSTTTPHHSFWNDDISVLDSAHFQHGHLHGPRQLTDVYLLALAIRNGGRLVGFDQRIPLTAVRGATAAHLVTL